MNRREMTMAMALGALGAAETASADDMAALQAQVSHVLSIYERAWNAADIDAMFSLATPDIHWVNIVGMHWRGLAEVKRAHQVYADLMFRDVPIQLQEIESLRPLSGGGAIVVARWAVGAFTAPSGEQRPPSRDRMTLVMIPQGGGLAIAHAANIEIVEAAAAFDPISGSPPPGR